MGGAMALGLVESGAVNAADLTVTAAHAATLAKFSAKGINVSLDNASAASGADVIFVAVKPWIVPSVVAELATVLSTSSPLVVSVAPGVKSADLLQMLSSATCSAAGAPTGKSRVPRLAYVIPNTAIEVLQSMTFISGITATDEDLALLDGLFAKCGSTMVVPEDHLMAGTALASCGIAYALRYIRAASEGGVELGFYAKDASKIVAQTAKGAASLLLAHGSHPEAEIDKVTTPGGMTIKGLNAMEEAGFTDAVIKGLKAGK